MALHYSDELSPAQIAGEHIDWGKSFMASLPRPAVHTGGDSKRKADGDGARKIRVAYLSPDFRRHAVALFMEPLLAHHDHSRFEIIGLSNVSEPDDLTGQFKKYFDRWHEIVSLSDAATAALVDSEQIDILVDLAGHTNGHRLGVLARKPAPIQVTYLGYPNTTGLPTVDFRLTDAVADPVGAADALHTEKLVRLDRCFLCYQPHTEAPAISPLLALGASRVTFACFAGFQKMTPAIFELWAQILQRVPNSRLLLKRDALAPGQSARERVLAAFKRHGVEASRIELEGGTVDLAAHLARYSEVDIMLDTYPYTGTTMTCESLWMGVPVVTLAGPAHVSRVAASILTYAGVPELVAQTPERYVDLAVGLVNDLPRLAGLRETLREKVLQSGLVDGAALARAVEAAYLSFLGSPRS